MLFWFASSRPAPPPVDSFPVCGLFRPSSFDHLSHIGFRLKVVLLIVFAALGSVCFGSCFVSCYRGSPSAGNLAIGSDMQCLSPVGMYYIGVNPVTGKKRLSAMPSHYRLSCSEPDIFVPCGKCVACLENRRNSWARRLEMQTWLSDCSTFVTLTYDNDHLPPGSVALKSDIQKFIKRFRHITRDYGIPLDSFKYFIVSEYGAKFGRPHYHGILFGVDCFGASWSPRVATVKDGYPVYTSGILADVWSKGFVSFDRVTPSSVRYVSKYITKAQQGNFALYSRGLGLDYLLNDNGLTPAADSAIQNGFIMYRSSSGFYKSGLPRWFDRYLEKFFPERYAEVKARRSAFASSVVPDLRLPSQRSVALLQRLHNETLTRKLDNET